jgi:flagellar hook-associated protein 1 FlgK
VSDGATLDSSATLTVSVTTPGPGGTTVEIAPGPTPPPSLLGQLGGTYQLLTDDLPSYLTGLDGFVSTLVSEVNDLHESGYDLSDPPQTGVSFFGGTTAADLTVLVTDPKEVAAADAPGTLDGSVAARMATKDLGATDYRSLVTDFGVKVASARRVAENQGILTAQVDAARESLSGVSIDEEMVNLLAAQRAYEGASRVITTLDSVLDTLINRTGLTR